MPCQAYTPEENHAMTRKELHKITRMLCGLCKTVEKKGNMCISEGALANGGQILDLIDKVPGLEKWWEDHKEQDKKRLEQESIQRKKKLLKKKALKKLTKEEKEALGI